MNSISTAQALADKHQFAGRDWFYRFREIEEEFEEPNCQRVAERLGERYSEPTKSWTRELNSEWVCRTYFSAKLIMSATLHISASEFSKTRNLRVVIPYLKYYSVLSLLRAICYTLPEREWKDGKLMQMSHAASLRIAVEHLRKFSESIANRVEKQVRSLKSERELISYRAPSSGDDQVIASGLFISLCTLLAEVAQFNSEVFEASLLRHADRTQFVLLEEYRASIASQEIDGHYFGDREDALRLDYLAREHPYPANLLHLMTEGHVDDFFGVWRTDHDDDTSFDPDASQGIIFDIP